MLELFPAVMQSLKTKTRKYKRCWRVYWAIACVFLDLAESQYSLYAKLSLAKALANGSSEIAG